MTKSILASGATSEPNLSRSELAHTPNSDKFKAIAVGASWTETDEPYFYVVHSGCDVTRLLTDKEYALDAIVCQAGTMEWADRIATALSASKATQS